MKILFVVFKNTVILKRLEKYLVNIVGWFDCHYRGG